jgi:hypothetical protein
MAPRILLINLIVGCVTLFLLVGENSWGESPALNVLSPTGSAPAAKPRNPLANALTAPQTVAENDTPDKKPGAEGEDTDKKPLDKKQIRKLLSAEPDPSLVLEPPPEPTPTPVPPPKPPAPPARPAPVAAATVNRSPALKGIPGQLPISPEVSIILVEKEFFPSKIRLKEGVQTRLFFTTTNEKPAAVVVEQLQIQRWVAKEGEQKPPSEEERAKWEAAKEVSKNRVTEVVIEPRRGTYSFHDVLSGAKGQIIVE